MHSRQPVILFGDWGGPALLGGYALITLAMTRLGQTLAASGSHRRMRLPTCFRLLRVWIIGLLRSSWSMFGPPLPCAVKASQQELHFSHSAAFEQESWPRRQSSGSVPDREFDARVRIDSARISKGPSCSRQRWCSHSAELNLLQEDSDVLNLAVYVLAVWIQFLFQIMRCAGRAVSRPFVAERTGPAFDADHCLAIRN